MVDTSYVLCFVCPRGTSLYRLKTTEAAVHYLSSHSQAIGAFGGFAAWKRFRRVPIRAFGGVAAGKRFRRVSSPLRVSLAPMEETTALDENVNNVFLIFVPPTYLIFMPRVGSISPPALNAVHIIP